MKIKFDLFTPTGKWKYRGVADIPDTCRLWDDDLLDVIDRNQSSVIKGIISRREMICVIENVDEKDMVDHFMCRLFMNK